jgi:hypothetical protein
LVRSGAIATGPRRSPDANEARYRIARQLIGARSESAELVLVGKSQRAPRHDLFAIAGALCEGLGPDVSVRVKLVGDAPAGESRAA